MVDGRGVIASHSIHAVQRHRVPGPGVAKAKIGQRADERAEGEINGVVFTGGEREEADEGDICAADELGCTFSFTAVSSLLSDEQQHSDGGHGGVSREEEVAAGAAGHGGKERGGDIMPGRGREIRASLVCPV